MLKTNQQLLKIIVMGIAVLTTLRPAMANNSVNNKILTANWKLAPASLVKEKGEAVSKTGYNTNNWHNAKVPTTVLGALVDNGTIKDPYFSMNLEKIDREQFKQSWWYRTEFKVEQIKGIHSRLRFEGINYRANIWLNGKKIASADTLKGMYRFFEINVTSILLKETNTLAVEVIPPVKGEFTIGFVDWTPRPNDENMGIVRPVILLQTGAVAISKPFMKTSLSKPLYNNAQLNLETEVENISTNAVTAVYKINFGDKVFSKEIQLKAGEKRTVNVGETDFKAFNINNPRLWWPVNMGNPDLYNLEYSIEINGKISDKNTLSFGIREFTEYMTPENYKGFKINGKKFQIRGGGWTDELLLREDYNNLEAQVLYTKHMNLNTIRLEGFWGNGHDLYNLCDKHGILLMAGWSCQWEWEEYCGQPHDEFGSISKPEDMELVAQMWHDQIVMFRNHPSIFVWIYSSDKLPRPALEQRYIDILNVVDRTRPVLTVCSNKTSTISGPSGAKMEGPYDYVTPNYWYTNTDKGGAFSFNTETGPGPQVPPKSSLLKMLPSNKLWPINEEWDYHCGRNEFNNLNRYILALNERYGEASNIDEFVMKAQVVNYEAIRPMFEAFAINRSTGIGVIQWMLNAAWPKLYWQLYDYYLMPNAAFYGTLKACKPTNILYNYGNNAIYVSNDYDYSNQKLSAEIKLYDIHSKLILNETIEVSVGEYAAIKIFDLPEIASVSDVAFLDLNLKAANGKLITNNFYWLSAKADVQDNEKATWVYTPNKEFADFKALQTMPKANISSSQSITLADGKIEILLTIKNTTDKIAFFIEATAFDKTSGNEILPIFWDDNYISLLPNEQKTLKATINTNNINTNNIELKLNGFNIE